MAPVRVRIAPSPTGDPHVGTAWIALFNYVFAKQQGGKFVLRIEDTDQTRARADSERMIFDALHWLGLSWDEGPDVGGPHAPYRQSERAAIYQKHANELLAMGGGYRCFCSEERLAKLRVQQEALGKKGYDRHCRSIPAADAAKRAETEPFVIRLALPLEGVISWKDELRDGLQQKDVNDLDDQVLLKSDGLPTYHLANVVDDHLMEITHVVRAEEWMSSTPKHVMLYQAFGWEPPKFFHMPLLRNADKDKTKISKRHNPVSIFYYRDAGFLPEALRNFLATLGWSFGNDREIFSLDEMIEAFTWDRVSLGGPVFDLKKLQHFNEQYVHKLSDDELADRVISWRLNREYLKQLVPLVRNRIKTLDEVVPLTEFFFTGDLDLSPVADQFKVEGASNAELRKAILAFVEATEARDGWSKEMLEDVAAKWLEAHKWTLKQGYPLLRLSVTGRKASPPLFETMVVLGKEITRRRLRRAADWIGARK